MGFDFFCIFDLFWIYELFCIFELFCWFDLVRFWSLLVFDAFCTLLLSDLFSFMHSLKKNMCNYWPFFIGTFSSLSTFAFKFILSLCFVFSWNYFRYCSDTIFGLLFWLAEHLYNSKATKHWTSDRGWRRQGEERGPQEDREGVVKAWRRP